MIRMEANAEKFAASGVEVLSGWSIRKWKSPERWLPASSRQGFTYPKPPIGRRYGVREDLVPERPRSDSV